MAACVIVDVHERPSGVPRYLASLEIEVEIAPLAVGDYVVAPGVLVERKTVRSAHTAIVQGTFWAQIGRLRRDSARHYLLLEGANVDHGPLPPAAIRGVCLAVTEQNIHVIRSTSPYDSALWLARLAARWSRRRGRAIRPIHDQTPTVPRELVPEAMLSAIPGISTQTARSLLDHFGSVVALADATEPDLQGVPGVGAARASAVLEAFHRASSPMAKKVV